MTTDPSLTPGPPAPAGPAAPEARPTWPPGSRLASWIATSLVVGWLLAYNVLRLAGGSPHESAPIAILPGIVVGGLIFWITLSVWRRQVPMEEAVLGQPGTHDQATLDALRIASVTVATLGAVALGVGVIVGLDWLDTDASKRSMAKILVAGWDLLIGAWLLTEAPRVLNGHADALESIATASVLTAVLGGVGLSRGWSESAQVLLIVLATAAGSAAQLAHWRALGGRGAPWGTALVAAIGVLSLILPLAL